MKNNILILILLFISILTFAQTKFTDGFNTGYKKGYCQDQGVGCIEPIPPISPIPKVGENPNSYTDGYNRGFEMGLNTRKSNFSSSKTSNRTRYQTAKRSFIDFTGNTEKDFLEKISIIQKVAEYKNNQYVDKKEYERIREIGQNVVDKIVFLKEFYKKEGYYPNNKLMTIIEKYESNISSINTVGKIMQSEKYFINVKAELEKLSEYAYQMYFNEEYSNIVKLIEKGEYNSCLEKTKMLKLIYNSSLQYLCEIYFLEFYSNYYLSNYSEALNAIDKSIKIKPTANSYYFKGLTEIALGNKKKGCSDLLKAGKMGEAKAYIEIKINCN